MKLPTRLITFSLVLGLIVGHASNASAISKDVYQEAVRIIRKESKEGKHSAATEVRVIVELLSRYLKMKDEKSVDLLGFTLISGVPISKLSVGTEVELTYGFIDPSLSSDNPTEFDILSPTIDISSVFYEVNIDPDTNDFIPIGTSFDAASNFSLPYVLSGFESQIHAIPFDSAGNPIFLDGGQGDNVAMAVSVNIEAVPEPTSTLSLLTLGTLGAAGLLRRKRKA